MSFIVSLILSPRCPPIVLNNETLLAFIETFGNLIRLGCEFDSVNLSRYDTRGYILKWDRFYLKSNEELIENYEILWSIYFARMREATK